MQTPKTIYVDMDDVLCETARSFVTVIEREFGKQISYEQITDFNVERACGLNSQQRAKLFEVVHRPEELLNMAPVEGAAEVLQQWAAAGYEIAIVTGRPPDASEPSVAWLVRYEIPYHSFTVVDKYGRFETENTVGIRLVELAKRRFAWAVEDSPKMAQFLVQEMGVPVALLDRPWNRGNCEHPKIERFSHWRSIGKTLPQSAVQS